MKFREQLLECMEICLRQHGKTSDEYSLTRAMEFGKLSKEIKHRIDTFDYSEQDARLERVEKLSTPLPFASESSVVK